MARHPNRIVNQKGPWPEFVGLKGTFVKEFIFQDIGMGDFIILKSLKWHSGIEELSSGSVS